MGSHAPDEGVAPYLPVGFRVLFVKGLPHPARPGLAAWSPQLDLIALVTTNENVLLYRMNGQRVWGISHRSDATASKDITIQKLKWRPDGKMIALGCSDGSTRIYDVNNGRAIHRIVSEAASFGGVTCVGWADNYSHLPAASQTAESSKPAQGTPEAMFDFDIAQMLPRLSALPSSSGPDSTFTSKTTLDALINAFSRGGESMHLDVMLIGEESGKILLNVFNSFLIGTTELSSLSHHFKQKARLVQHAASADLSTHSLLMEGVQGGGLLFSTMDILFVQQFGQYLFQLASTSTRVQALVRYIKETVAALVTEFKGVNDLAQRYIGIIDEDAKNAGSDVSLELFELLVTGVPTQVLKEWLVDTLTERGQKRWEKTSVTGYETLRRLVHENLLPACERLTVFFSRLRGLARWKERGSPLGLEPDDFTRCLDVVAGFTLFAHEFLIKLNAELDLFTSFMDWLRYALDQLSTVVNLDDKPPEDPQMDTLKIAAYVEHHLKASALAPFFGRGATSLADYKGRGESIAELYSRNRKVPALPGFADLAEYLEDLCRVVFAKPQQAMRQQLRLGRPLLVAEGRGGRCDLIMHSEKPGAPVTYMAFQVEKDEGDELVFVRCSVTVVGGLSNTSEVAGAKVALSLPTAQTLVDIRFVDSSLALLILRSKADGPSRMLTLNYTALTYDTQPFTADTSDTQSILARADTLPAQPISPVSHRLFDDSFVPAEITVNGKADRRVGCVLAEDRVRYQVFDLDAEELVEDDEESNEETMEVDN